MKVLLLGAAGFIGTNLTLKLAEDTGNQLTLVDRDRLFFEPIHKMNLKNITIIESDFSEKTDFDKILSGQEIVYHLASTNIPTTSNQQIPEELSANIVVTARMLEACVRCGVKKVVFISSGGTVYGNVPECPLHEDLATNPISSYGIQKITIEKLLYLYQYMHGLDYRVVRLANPYGPYQRPNGLLGAVTTFTYKALRNEEILVYGDGRVVRDFIYIDDAVRGIVTIANGESKYKTFNLGCGYGTSIKEVLEIIHEALDVDEKIIYQDARKVDVAENYLDISRYEKEYGSLNPLSMREGVLLTAEFLKKEYRINCLD